MTEIQDKHSQLDKLQTSILTNRVCSDLASQATQLIFGSGNSSAKIVFIGEAPGKQEDLQGEPFVGASGKLLNEMLASIGLDREEVYITNIVKYRPPENRDPSKEEKESFWPYLVRQLDIIQPKLVVTLGRHSMECFLPGAKISVVHGEPSKIGLVNNQSLASDEVTDGEASDYHHLVILPLYHPASALYNGGMRQMLMQDFKHIPSVLAKLESKQI